MNERYYGMLLHLGYNMWGDKTPAEIARLPPRFKVPEEVDLRWGPVRKRSLELRGNVDFLRFDESAWRYTTGRMQKMGMNLCVIDIGEGLVYPSHPELGCKGAWTPEKMRAELKRLRAMGLEPVPKLNFSATHDLWLGPYSRMTSTAVYYQVVADVIRDVCEIFDNPRLFHLGWDEEDFWHQAEFDYVVIRQSELWWHDILFTIKEVEKRGTRAWIWSDKIWHSREEFVKRMPKSVLQSNWYYEGTFDPDKKSAVWPMVHAYDWLEEAGYDQLPCCSSCGYWRLRKYNNPCRTIEYCRTVAKIAPERMKGLLMAPWCQTMDFAVPWLDDALDLMPPAKKEMDRWLGA